MDNVAQLEINTMMLTLKKQRERALDAEVNVAVSSVKFQQEVEVLSREILAMRETIDLSAKKIEEQKTLLAEKDAEIESLKSRLEEDVSKIEGLNLDVTKLTTLILQQNSVVVQMQEAIKRYEGERKSDDSEEAETQAEIVEEDVTIEAISESDTVEEPVNVSIEISEIPIKNIEEPASIAESNTTIVAIAESATESSFEDAVVEEAADQELFKAPLRRRRA